MRKLHENITDTEIVSLIEEKLKIGWELLYDKYAPITYGFILRITDDEAIADEVLMETFTKLSLDKKSLSFNKSLCSSLLNVALKNATRILHHKELSINSKKPKDLQTLFYRYEKREKR